MTRAQKRRIRKIIKAGNRIRCTSFDELISMSEALQGLAVHVLTLHDDGCTPSVCICSPEYIIEQLTAEKYLSGQRAQAKWVKETTS